MQSRVLLLNSHMEQQHVSSSTGRLLDARSEPLEKLLDKQICKSETFDRLLSQLCAWPRA